MLRAWFWVLRILILPCGPEVTGKRERPQNMKQNPGIQVKLRVDVPIRLSVRILSGPKTILKHIYRIAETLKSG